MQQLFIAVAEISQVLTLFHEFPCRRHFGSKKRYHRAEDHFFWPGRKLDVRDWRDSCIQCLGNSERNKNTDIVPHVARLVSVSGIFLLMRWGHCLSVRVLSTFYQSDVNLANCIRPRKRQFKKYKQLALHWLKNEPLNQVSCQPPQ